MTKIVFISDTHTLHDELDLPESDILVHSGDFCNNGSELECIAFAEWISGLNFKHIVVVAGNHDKHIEANPDFFDDYPEITYLQDSSCIIDGLKFYGSPWQPIFFDWSFNLPRGSQLAEKWDLIENDTDVLITHGPPRGILDYVPYRGGENVGCHDLLVKVLEIKPKVHVFGHIHYSYGITKFMDTVFINTSTCAENYSPTNKPIEIEL